MITYICSPSKNKHKLCFKWKMPLYILLNFKYFKYFAIFENRWNSRNLRYYCKNNCLVNWCVIFLYIDNLDTACTYNILSLAKTRLNVQSAYLNTMHCVANIRINTMHCVTNIRFAALLCLRQKVFRRLNLEVLLTE